MDSPILHDWNLSPEEAARAQAALRSRLSAQWDGRAVSLVGGVDVSTRAETARAAIVVLRFPELTPLEGAVAEVPLVFPYVPGLLAFREAPAILAAWRKLETRPDLLMFDGQGIAHPRGVGIAAHLGVWLDLPTIGVAKSRLYGRHAEPGPEPGDLAWMHDPRSPARRIIGAALRTKARTNPLYVSPGQYMDPQTAVDFVLRCVTRYRLPETTRWAHRHAGGEPLP